MQQANAKGIDVINEVLEECLLAFPVSGLLIGFYQQYQRRGFLTKKQLQGLHSKAATVSSIAPAKLATLAAIIRKMPNRYKSELPDAKPLFEKDTEAETMIVAILDKFPQHKRALFLKAKLDHLEPLTATETGELKKFLKLAQERK